MGFGENLIVYLFVKCYGSIIVVYYELIRVVDYLNCKIFVKMIEVVVCVLLEDVGVLDVQVCIVVNSVNRVFVGVFVDQILLLMVKNLVQGVRLCMIVLFSVFLVMIGIFIIWDYYWNRFLGVFLLVFSGVFLIGLKLM